MNLRVAIRASAMLVAACLAGPSGAAREAWVTSGTLTQIRGLQSPEDLELLPDGRHLLISEMAGEHGEPGHFALLDLQGSRLSELVPQAGAASDWGDPACRMRPPAALSPHGIHLSRGADGRMMVLAVNHGDTESVQAYDLAERGGALQLTWRGCVDNPYNFNDVAATADGFIGTHQFDKAQGEGPEGERFLFSGAITGYAVRWSRSTGYRKIFGTEAALPNGITVSRDGRTAWMAVTAGRAVRKIDLDHDAQVAEAALPMAPDNLSWTADGRLLVTGADDVHRLATCATASPHCQAPFAVAEIDPATLNSRVIFRHDGSLLLGASVAIVAAHTLYLGSFAGDHLLRAPVLR